MNKIPTFVIDIIEREDFTFSVFQLFCMMHSTDVNHLNYVDSYIDQLGDFTQDTRTEVAYAALYWSIPFVTNVKIEYSVHVMDEIYNYYKLIGGLDFYNEQIKNHSL